MKITDDYAMCVRPSLVAPVIGGALGGLCPEGGFRRVDATATGLRPWSPLIT